MDRQWLDKAISTQDHLANVAHHLTIREHLRHRARVTPALAPKAHADHYSVTVGATPSNASKNRWAGVHPYDRTRVIPPNPNTSKITNHDDESNNDDAGDRPYLNASWVRERVGGTWWIASQAPLPNTAHAFLSLLLAPVANPHAPPAAAAPQPVRTVVQLTPLKEGRERKADPYFPTTVGESLVVPAPDGRGPALSATLLSAETRPDACCVHSRVAVLPLPPTPASASSSSSSPSAPAPQPIVFDHLFFVSWPDHGAPRVDERPKLLAFMRLAERTNKAAAAAASRADGPASRDAPCAADPPIVVGCSGGVGRTGSYIALASLLRAYGLLSDAPPPPAASAPLPESPLGPLPDAISADLVAQEVDALREQRPGMVGGLQQLSLIYGVLVLALTERGG